MTTAASDEQIQLARASYARCQRVPDFFRQFYDRLLASDPEIPGFFVNTKFAQQEKLLEHGILLLLIFAKRNNPSLLSRITERHGPGDLAIPVRLYPMFVTSFLATVQKNDPGCDQATLQAWTAALTPGIDLMTRPA